MSDTSPDSATVREIEQPLVTLLLSQGHAPETADDLLSQKLRHRPLPLLPTSSAPTAAPVDARQARRLASKTISTAFRPTNPNFLTSTSHPKPLSAKQKRQTKLHYPPLDKTRYEDFEELRKLWAGYVEKLVAGMRSVEAAQRIAAADLHGAVVEVVRCRCVDRVGLKGVVVRESRQAVEIVLESTGKELGEAGGEGNKRRKGKGSVRLIPKEGTIFRMMVGKMKVEVHGEAMRTRPAERTVKKWKTRVMLDL